jgi:hypothetical protein
MMLVKLCEAWPWQSMLIMPHEARDHRWRNRKSKRQPPDCGPPPPTQTVHSAMRTAS